MKTVTTIQGDTWDSIAKRVYGNERRAQNLMEERKNIELLDIQVFPGGVVVATPEVPDYNVVSDLPAWRK